MGLWGNTAQQATPKKKLANISVDQINSIQQAVPVKYLAGRQYVGGDFISPAYNSIAKPIKTKTGKSETSTTGYNYFCDFALVFCMGGRAPVDAVYKVIVDNDILWTGNVTRTPGVDKEIITMPQNFGTMYLYWGSETQAIDSVLLSPRGTPGELGSDPTDNTTWPPNTGSISAGDSNPFSGHYDTHPAYRGQCYGVFKKWKLGRDRTNVPNIQLELKRGTPWFGGASYAAEDRGVNPLSVLYDWLTDPRFGMGMADSQLNQTLWNTAFSTLESFPARISPLITSQEDFRRVVAQLLEYYDGWIRRNGKVIEVGVWNHGSNIVSSGTLTDDDLLHEPELEPLGWGPTQNEVTVVYKDREHHFNDYTQIHRDPNNFRITGGPRPETLQRPWITDKDLAKRYAREIGAIAALPYTSGELTVRREWLTNNSILPGTVITYNSGFYGLTFMLRVDDIEYEADNAAEAKLTVEWERSKWPGVYYPPGFQGPGGFFTGPRALYKTKIMEVPYLLADQKFATQVVCLAVRGNVEVHGMRIWASFDGGTSYQQLPDASSTSTFAAYGTLTATIGPANTSLFYSAYGIDQDDVVSQTAGQQTDDNLLAIVDNEFTSIGTITPTGGGTFTANQIRAQYGTTAATHNSGVDAFFMYRSNLLLLDHVDFVPGTTVLFKLQPFTEHLDYDLSMITPISYTIFGFAPVAAPILSPPPGAFVTSVTVSSTPAPTGWTTRYTLDGTPVAPTSNALTGSLTLSATTNVRVRFFAPNSQTSAETSGTYTLVTGTAPTAQCSSPTWTFSGTLGVTSGNITLTAVTAGSSISYSKNGGATTAYSSPVALAVGDFIEFWATKSGLTDSAHVFVNNEKNTYYGGTGWDGHPIR